MTSQPQQISRVQLVCHSKVSEGPSALLLRACSCHVPQVLTAVLLFGSSRGVPATGKTGKRKAKLPPERAGKAKRAPGALLAVLSAFSCLPTVSGLF